MDYAMSKSVLVATPVTMLGLLRTVALFGNTHLLRSKGNLRRIEELYKRITTMIDHFQKVGGHPPRRRRLTMPR